MKDQIYSEETVTHCPGKAISKCKIVYDEKLIKMMFDAFPYNQIKAYYEE